MAKEPLQEKELQIKKTARRRLVGAIAMVVILLLVLPFMLKDQATDSAQDAVKITIVSDANTSEPIPELNDKELGFESNVNPTEVTGYTQPTVLPSQQDANAPTSDSKTHISLPKVTPPAVTSAAVAPSQTVDEHSKLSQVLDASNTSPSMSSAPSQQVQEKQTSATEAKVNNAKLASNQQIPAKQNVANQNKTNQATEANAQKAVEAKQAEEAKEKAEKKKAEALKAEKIKAEQQAKAKAEAEKAKQSKESASKEAKAKENSTKQDVAKEDKSSTASNVNSGKFFVQYGVFSDPKNAEKLQSSLKQKGYVAETESIDATSKKVRLRSKVYSTKEEALKALKSVQGAGFTAIVAGK